MAGERRGRPDGNFVKITLSNGLPIVCPIYRGNTAGLGRCVEGGYIPEEVYFLSCRHTLCKQCFHARTEYVCRVDKKKTIIQRGVEHSYSSKLGLHKIILECPLCCDALTYKSIQEHVELFHPECFGQEAQYPPLNEQVRQPSSPTFVAEDYAAGIRGRYGSLQAESPSSFRRQSEYVPRKLIDDNSSDSSLGGRHQESGLKREDSEEIVKCEHCFTPLEFPEGEEHEKNCPQRLVPCHACSEPVTVVSYDKHVQSHYEANQRKKTGAQREEWSGPISTEELAAYIQSLKSRNRKFNESFQPPIKLLAAIDALAQEAKLSSNSRPLDAEAVNQPLNKDRDKDREDTRGKKKRNEPVEIPATEPTPQAKKQQDKGELGQQGNSSSSHSGQPGDPQQREITNHELCRKEIELLHDDIRHLKEEKMDLQTALQELQRTVQELGTSEEKNGKTMAKLESKLNSASTHRLELEELIRKQRSEFQAKWEEELKSANTHRLKLEELIEKQASKLQEAENCVRKLKTKLHMDKLLPAFEHIWKLQPYSALRKSLVFNDATLSTGVLSVNTPGYKIELMISVKGDYREWRRQWLKDESSCSVPAPDLSLMLRIHKGDHDELLAWPFRNKISLLLINHLDEDKSKLLELGSDDADSDCLKKPVRGALNPMFGFSRVISLQDLENLEEGFLFQDCIVFKFTVHRRE